MSNTELVVKLKIVRNIANVTPKIPHNGTAGSAGVDLAALIDEPLTMTKGKQELIPTGIAIHIANPNYAAIILPRSGLGHKHGIVLGNLVGLIDSDYQGEIMVSCWNRGNDTYVIKPGERIAQLVVIPVAKAKYELCSEFEAETERGSGGFGHTGKTYAEAEI